MVLHFSSPKSIGPLVKRRQRPSHFHIIGSDDKQFSNVFRTGCQQANSNVAFFSTSIFELCGFATLRSVQCSAQDEQRGPTLNGPAFRRSGGDAAQPLLRNDVALPKTRNWRGHSGQLGMLVGNNKLVRLWETNGAVASRCWRLTQLEGGAWRGELVFCPLASYRARPALLGNQVSNPTWRLDRQRGCEKSKHSKWCFASVVKQTF